MTSVTLAATRPRGHWLRLALTRLRLYWVLIKDLQTGLLLVTAAAGYASGCCTNINAGSLIELLGSLFLATAGCTVLNMAFDRDIDRRMRRTANRPLPAGRVKPAEAWALGGVAAVGGLIWSFQLDPLYGAVVIGGVMLNALVYTVWLKRRTPFAILIGGMAGGMPALAGRVLATGAVDLTGLLLGLCVLLWIPTHIMTFTIKYQDDYARAGIPTFPTVYGVRATRLIIAVSTILLMGAMQLTAGMIVIPGWAFTALAILGGIMSAFTALALLKSTRPFNFALYKGASIYMLLSMILIFAGGF